MPAPVRVQSVAASSIAAPSTSQSLAFDAATGAGHLLVAFVMVNGSASPPLSSITDGVNTWTVVVNGLNRASNGFAVAYCATAASVTTVTASFPGSYYSALALIEYSGVAAASALETSLEQDQEYNTTQTVGPLTATTPHDILVAGVSLGLASGTPWVAGTGYTLAGTCANLATADNLDSGAPGSQGATLSWAGPSLSQGALLAFRSATPSIVAGTATLIATSTGNSVALTGYNTAWTAGTPGTPTFTLGGGTGAGITAQTVTGAGAATLTISAGTGAGALTLTDPSTGATATITVLAQATAFTLSGPTGGLAGTASTAFTVAESPAGAALRGTVTITPHDGGAGGTFTPATFTRVTGQAVSTVTYTPPSSLANGTAVTISLTNDASNPTVANPANLTYTVYGLDATIPGTATFTPTYHGIGVIAEYQGDYNRNASLIVQFRKTGDTAWRYCLGPGALTDPTSSSFRIDTDWPKTIVAVGNTTNFSVQLNTNSGLTVGQQVHLSGIGGATGANGDWMVASVSATVYAADTFAVTKLDGTTAPAPGVWTSGGLSSGWLLPRRTWSTKLLFLVPGTRYDVQLTWGDADGVSGGGTTRTVLYSGTTTTGLTTLADNLPDAWSLTVTKFVDGTLGSDSGPGTGTGAAAWKTIDYALAHCVADDVIDCAGGPGNWYTVTPTTILSASGVVLRSHAPATTGGRAMVSGLNVGQWAGANPSTRAVLFLGIQTSPTTSGNVNAGVWVKCDGAGSDPAALVGPHGGGTYSNIWTWHNAAGFGTLAATETVSVAAYVDTGTITDDPKRLNVWPQGTVGTWSLQTAAGFGEVVNTNLSHNYGVWIDPTTGLDAYVRLPGDIDPNTTWMFFGHDYNGAYTLSCTGANDRVSGFEFRCMGDGVTVAKTARNLILDRNLFWCNSAGVWYTGDKSVVPNLYADLVTIQDNAFLDSNMWGLDSANPAYIPWNTVKGGFVCQDGTAFIREAQTGQPCPISGTGDPTRLVVRYNTMRGNHDMIAMGNDNSFDDMGGNASDIYGNYKFGGQDDGPEFTGSNRNVAIWGNYIAHTLTGCSLNQCTYGPYFYLYNIHWRTGSMGEPVDRGGDSTSDGDAPIPGGTFWKSGTTPAYNFPWVCWIANTSWTDADTSVVDHNGVTERSVPLGPYPSGGGVTISQMAVNNIIRTSSYLGAYWNPPAVPGIGLVEDYTQYYLTNVQAQTATVRLGGIVLATTLAQWQSSAGQGAHDQPAGGTDWSHDIDAQFVSPTTGDLRLVAGANLANTGHTLNNVADVPLAAGAPYVSGGYYGAAPSLGAVARTAATVRRPLGLDGGLSGLDGGIR